MNRPPGSPSPQLRRNGWSIVDESAPDAPEVYAFVHAGGRAERFLDWQPELIGDARIVAMCPPGVGHRFTEPRAARISDLASPAAREIAASVNGEFLLFGHSLGAVVAFETARRLPMRPAALIVSGCAGAPLLPSERAVRLAGLQDREFAEEVRFFGGIPSELEVGSDMESLLLGHLQRDFALVANYEYEQGPLLDVPVVTVVGAADPHVDQKGATSWGDITTGGVEHHEVAGGHFYFDQDDREILALLRRTIRRFCGSGGDTTIEPTATHTEII